MSPQTSHYWGLANHPMRGICLHRIRKLGAERAIRMALAQAGLSAADVGYINAHGTATPLNDQAEAAVIHRLFGSQTPCSSTKHLTGHTLGAAGATEAALGWSLILDATLTCRHRISA